MANFSTILDHAIENGLNVLLVGKHGVGKTAIVKEVFEARGLKWKYFSASTMDPWVDFIGVPKEKVDPDTGESYLDLVRPRDIANDEVEAIFFDELNRSHKKIRNAIMELIQFGSINGKKFKNLRIIWAAINPDDDEDSAYDVEKLDPAQLDRFHIHIDVPYKPSMAFFRKVYGERGELAVKWWNDQNIEVKNLISPRRLDYAVNVLNSSGDVRYVFNSRQVNVTEFLERMNRGNPVKDLEELLTKSDSEKRAFFADHNQLKRVMSDLVDQNRFMNAFAHLLPEEEILGHLQPKKRRSKFALYAANNPGQFDPRLIDVVLSNQNAYAREVWISFTNHKKNAGGAQTAQSTPMNVDKLTINGKDWHPNRVRVCFTGNISGYTREQATKLVEQVGARVSNSATYGVTHLVSADKPGKTKVSAAQRNNIEIVSEQAFLDAFVNNINSSLISSAAGDIVVLERNEDGSPKRLSINSKEFNANRLRCDTFLQQTGRRFRMTSEQRTRYTKGHLTREEAFEEWIKSL
jgi:hypothetical protein